MQATLRGPGQEAMDKEIKRQLLERVEELELDIDAAILWTLHKRFEFGKKKDWKSSSGLTWMNIPG